MTTCFQKYTFAAILSLQASLAFASDALTVYTSRGEELIQPLLEQFSQETGIEVQMLSDKAPKLIARLQSEGEASPADVFLPADVSNLEGAAQKGLLAPIQSDILNNNIPAKYRDDENMWYGLGKRARVIIYNLETVNPAQDLSTYENLADPKWQGEILVRTSSHPYNLSLIAAMIEEDGEEATEKWVEGIVSNLARNPQGGDRDQIKAVAAGEGKIAIANSYYYALMKNSNIPEEKQAADATGIYFPNQNAAEGELSGTHINLSGAGVVAHSDQKADAQKLIEFLSSAKVQKLYAEFNQEYPVNPEATPSETLQSFGTFKEDETPLASFAGNIDKALQMTDRSGWK